MFVCSYKAKVKLFPLIHAVLDKSISHFLRIKGHQLNLCLCISVFACFENIFWSACRAQVLTPLTFLPRSCLPRSFPERHNCTVAPKVLYLCFICLYLCILYSCICMFCTFISGLPRICFVARWMTEKWSVYFCNSLRFTFYVEKKLFFAQKHSTQISLVSILVHKGLEIYKLLVDKLNYSILMSSLLCWRKQT